MLRLIENEVLKIVYRKKLLFVAVIITILVLLFAYGQYVQSEQANERIMKRLAVEEIDDWRVYVEQQWLEHRQRLDNPYLTDERRARLQVEVEQYAYYLEHDINPNVVGSATFTKTFMEQSMFMLYPLLVMLLVTDIITGEFSGRTVKLLLTKPLARWKILLSKMLAMVIMVTLLIIMLVLISACISSVIFGYGGWNAPMITGFSVVNGSLDVSQVVSVAQWELILMICGLAWIVGIVVGALTMMVSVLVQNTGAVIGIMMSSLIAGSFLNFFLSDWQAIKYLFSVNLNIAGYLSGAVQPIEGMSFLFSITVLAVWAIGAVVTSFITFNRQDMLV